MIAEARELQEDHERRGLARRRATRAGRAATASREIATHVPSVKIAYGGAVKTIDDPATKITELASKFGSLQQ